MDLEDFDFDAVGLSDEEHVRTFLAAHSDRALNDVFRRSSTALGTEINRFDNLDELQTEHVRDEEAKAGARFTWLSDGSALRVGMDYVAKARTYESRLAAPEEGELAASARAYSAFDADEHRLSGYAQWTATFGAVGAELGVRAEHTRLEIVSTLAQPVADAAAALAQLGFAGGDRVRERGDDFDLNPAAHLRWDVSERLVLRLGAASTLRRPAFDELNPTLLLDGDESVLGNPDLRAERALGFDGGADVTLDAENAIVGLNAFYRRIEDKIELNGVDEAVNALLQAEIDEEIEAAQYVNNPHDGVVYGAELDLSYPLAVLNAPNFHIFANYTYMHSRIRDASAAFAVDRPFALQPDYHYNAGFDHLIAPWRLTWGASYQKRGGAQEWNYAAGGAREVVDVRFGGNLEAFIEKTFADRFVVRVAAQNLLDAVRSDVARVYETHDQYRRRAPISAELDREESDPWVLVTFRGTF